MPAAEVDVTPALLRRLLAEQHPDLAEQPVTVLANGWDNVVFRVGGDLLARLPRRGMAAQLVSYEQRWLPLLAARLPLPIPAPVRTGRPGPGYPWPWSIVPYLPGQVAAETPPADPAAAAVSLGGFLAALHTSAPPGAPVNPFRGVPLAERTDTVMQNLSVVADQVDTRAARRAWAAALAAPRWREPPVWVHGDLHPANILVHHGGLSGVLDFGDLTAGDPLAGCCCRPAGTGHSGIPPGPATPTGPGPPAGHWRWDWYISRTRRTTRSWPRSAGTRSAPCLAGSGCVNGGACGAAREQPAGLVRKLPLGALAGRGEVAVRVSHHPAGGRNPQAGKG
jgi:Phosphotransferase enzyme family